MIFLCILFFKCNPPQPVKTIIDPPAGFYAFHTDLAQEGEPFNKYKDLVVVLDKGKHLVFSRETGYQPKWVTPEGETMIEELTPDRDPDPNFEYTYVRLIEQGPDKIVVHWRYIPDIERLDAANEALDPLNIHGFQGAVHEFFTIYPDFTVERELKMAEGVRYEDWNNPAIITRQEIKLAGTGIEHGEVKWGETGPFYPRQAVEGAKVSKPVTDPVLSWTFDEGMEPHEDLVKEKVSGISSEIEGSRTLFKKGVSGTALGFDGYYTGVSLASADVPELPGSFTVEAWVALDAYPYNNAAVVHRSTGFGEAGFYLGIDPYGHVLFRVNGQEIKSEKKLEQAVWAHIAGVVKENGLSVVVNGVTDNLIDLDKVDITIPGIDLQIGRNSEKSRCTDYVREFDQNIEYIQSIQGLIDEVRIYTGALNDGQLMASYNAFLPDDLTSPLAVGVLPGEHLAGLDFGAYYTSTSFSEVWDGLWRNTSNDEIIVRFDNLPTSVVFWKGTNYAANWVADNNRWFADQSSEIWGPHGCSEHMADKQGRMCYARIIESSPARAVIHWRYPCVDVGYVCGEETDWTDEYHTIYPDGTGIRSVFWNEGGEGPGFQDIQLLTNPGESALDVVNLQALSVANRHGETADLTWAAPNIIPELPIEDADIELINTKSDHKIFLAFQGACLTPWGEHEQSEFTEDPFAGPWNHWPMHVVPSDGRFAVDNDRVTHFALAANDCAPEFGSMVFYGFTNQKIRDIIPVVRSWQDPLKVINVSGAESLGFNKAHKSFEFIHSAEDVSFTVGATEDIPLINPCFVLKQWSGGEGITVSVDGVVAGIDKVRRGITRDVDGTETMIVWLELESDSPVRIEIK